MKRGKPTATKTDYYKKTDFALSSNHALLPPHLPQYFADRPVTHAQITKALLGPKSDAYIPTTVLFGLAGTGKSLLASTAIQSKAVKNRFTDGIFWMHLGQKPYDFPEQVNLIGQCLDDSWEQVTSTSAAVKALKQILADKSVLLVLDDVATVNQAIKLKSEGPDSHVLITTRNERIARAIRGKEVTVEKMDVEASIGILDFSDSALTNTDSQEDKAANLASKLSHNPHGLAIARQLIKSGSKTEDLLSEIEPLQKAEVHPWLISMYLNKMKPAQKALTEALGILPARVPIPLSAIHLLWHRLEQETGKVNHIKLIQELVEADVIRRRNHDSKIFVNDFLIDTLEEYPEEQVEGWHNALLSAYNRDELSWPDLPDDGYVYRFLCHHLSASSKSDELPGLLLSYEWLQAKLQFTDVDALFEDFNYIREDKTLRVIQEAIRLSAPILSKDVSQLGSQLIGRLQELDIPALRDLVASIRIADKPEPAWLDPTKVNLDIPGSALLQAYRGHDDVIHALDIEMGGRQAISASSDKTLKLWDLRTGAQLRTYKGHRDLVHTVAFTPNGKNAISGSDDLSIKVWDIEEGTNLRTYALHEDKILAIAPLYDNKRVLSSDESGKLLLWDLWTGEIERDMDAESGRIWSIALTPEREVAFTAGDDHTISCWNLKGGKTRAKLTAHDDWIWSLKVTPDGRYLISASEDQNIIVWDLFSGRVARVLTGHQAGVRAIDLSRDGKVLVSASEDQSMIVWDFEEGKILRTFTGHDDWVWDMAVTPDGKGVLSASDDSSLKLWSLTGHTRQIEKEAHKKGVRALTVSPDNAYLLSASDDTSIMKWQIDKAQVDSVFQGHIDWVWDLEVNSKGNLAFSTSFDCSINAWDLKNESRKFVLNGHDDWVWCAALSWNNKYLVSGSEDKSVCVWDVEKGRLIRKLRGHTAGVTSVVVSNDNRYVISASLDHTLRVWQLDDGKLVHILRGHEGPVRSMLISQLDQRIISASDDGTIRIWNFTVGSESGCLRGHTAPIRHLALTPMGYYVVSASEDKTIRVWDLSNDQSVFELKGHTKEIRQIDVSLDGRLIASAGDDHALFLWDLEEGKRISSFYADHPLTRCVFTIEGQRVIAGDAGGGVHFLRIDEW